MQVTPDTSLYNLKQKRAHSESTQLYYLVRVKKQHAA
jgi:hypothetical protein